MTVSTLFFPFSRAIFDSSPKEWIKRMNISRKGKKREGKINIHRKYSDSFASKRRSSGRGAGSN
jgi:hypothetical protein